MYSVDTLYNVHIWRVYIVQLTTGSFLNNIEHIDNIYNGNYFLYIYCTITGLGLRKTRVILQNFNISLKGVTTIFNWQGHL